MSLNTSMGLSELCVCVERRGKFLRDLDVFGIYLGIHVCVSMNMYVGGGVYVMCVALCGICESECVYCCFCC